MTNACRAEKESTFQAFCGISPGVSKNGKKSFPIFGHINFYHEEHEGHEG